MVDPHFESDRLDAFRRFHVVVYDTTENATAIIEVMAHSNNIDESGSLIFTTINELGGQGIRRAFARGRWLDFEDVTSEAQHHKMALNAFAAQDRERSTLLKTAAIEQEERERFERENAKTADQEPATELGRQRMRNRLKRYN